MITPYAYTQFIPRPRPRCEQCRGFLTVSGITDIVAKYDGEQVVYDVQLPTRLNDQSIYNVPVNLDEYQGPDRTIRELPIASKRALALNGYNHTEQGIIDIGAWLDGTRIFRPEHLLLFQPLFVDMGKKLHIGSTFISEHPPGWDFEYKRRLYLSAFDALNLMANHTISACNNRQQAHPDGGRLGPQPEHLDVLLVHQLSSRVNVKTDKIVTSRRYQKEQTRIWTPQKLYHSVEADYTVYIGGMSTCACPVGTGSKTDYIRLLVVHTDVYSPADVDLFDEPWIG
jgi:hypothetical protein